MTKVTLWNVIGWIIGIFFGLGGIAFIVSGEICGIPLIMAACISIPPIISWIEKKVNIELSGGLKVVIVIVLFVTYGVTMDASTPTPVDVSTSPPTSPSTSTPTSTPASTPTSTPTPTVESKSIDNLKTGDTASTRTKEVTIIGVRKQYYWDYNLPNMGMGTTSMSQEASPGNTLIIANVNIKNTGKDRLYLGSSDLSVTDSECYRYDSLFYLGDNALDLFQELYPNQQVEGIVIFEVPKDATELRIQYDFASIFGRPQIASWTIPDK